ncbi:hypothetical protein J6590_033949 [Homalodisca vitripennis]|nr:hypothetical protein J6590_033949 [Homalodisca vitripennis]
MAGTARHDVPLLWRALNALWYRLVDRKSMTPHHIVKNVMAGTARRDVPLLWRALNACGVGWLTENQCRLTVTSASRSRQERDGRYGASRCSTTVEGAERAVVSAG